MAWTVLVYTPNQDHWDELSPHPVNDFTMATLRGQLLVVGGIHKSTNNKANTILTFDKSSRQWLTSLPLMPVVVSHPVVVEYQDHLIVAGGRDSNGTKTTDVNILDTTTNKWTAAEPLLSADVYNTFLIGDTQLYLVGRDTKQVLKADVPSLMSGASSGVWETVASVSWYWSFPVNVGNTLLVLGGRDKPSSGKRTADIFLYNPMKDQWIKCGELLKPMSCYCTKLYNNLYVFDWSVFSSSVCMSTPFFTY